MNIPSLREVLDQWCAATSDRSVLQRLDRVNLARTALDLGCPTLASEILREVVSRDGASPQARFLGALASAKTGALRESQRLVDGLLSDAGALALHSDARALAGRIAKDRWMRLPPGGAREQAGAQAIACYQRAWSESGDAFPGINTATMLLLTGQAEAARALAGNVRAAARSAANMPAHWREATLGEAALLLGDLDGAARHYASAAAAAGRQVGHVASMRRQLRLLSSCMTVPDAVLAALAVPRVVVFTGHMIDAPDRPSARFPPALETAVAARIAASLADHNAGFGYCSAACGADLLFIEAMFARNADVHITLPFDRADFISTSVAFAGTQWVERFEQALARATSVTYGVRERFLGDQSLFAYAGLLMQGAAVLRADELEAEPLMLAVLDDASPDRPAGGTRDVLGHWQSLGLPAECIELSALRAQCPADASAPAADAVARVPDVYLREAPLRRDVRTMLFADMVGYSRLSEEDTPSFLVHFLGAVAEIVAAARNPPSFVNTWGDGFFMVFDEVSGGAEFALQLREAVGQRDWPSVGLPEGTSIRIGMHTGPVFHAHDRLLGRENYFGSHVIRAARIEPVVAPGAIFVSAEFAFILSVSGSRAFAIDFLGTVPLAKDYSSAPLYRLRKRSEAE